MGFGTEPGTHLPEEVRGSVPRMGLRPGDPMQWAIGQGSLDATPLQVANAMAAIARGEFLSPTILIEGGPPQVRRAIPLQRDQLAAVQKGMFQVVNIPHGTGYNVFRADASAGEKFPVVCGKTGTADAEPQRIDSNHNGRIDRGDQVVREGNMAWFAGYSSYIDPRIAFAVVVEYVKEHGSTAAGPIARELVHMCNRRGYVE
jgi:penicillin-binding protein 2